MTKAVIYARISDSDGDPQSLGVARQEADCKAFCKQRKWSVVGTFIDNDISASAYSRKRRPQFEAMVQSVERGEADAVVAWHIDRLYRKPVELERLIELAESKTIQIATLYGELNLSTSDGRAMARVLVAMAAKSSDDSSRRIRRKLQERADDGRHTGGPRVYGYESTPAGEMVIVEREAAVIRDVAQRVLAGISLYSLVAELNERQEPTARGSRWNVNTLRGILTGPRIAGIRVHQGQQHGKAAWAPILDESTWEQVRSLFDARRTGTRTPRRYLLTGGIATCGKCGSWLHAQPRSNGRPGYNCRREKGGCGGLTVDGERLDETVTELVLKRTDSPRSRLRKPKQDDLAPLLAEVGALEEKLRSLGDDYGAGRINRTAFLAAQKTLDANVQRARQRIQTHQSRSALDPYDSPGSLREAWPALTLETRRAIIDSIVTVAVMPATRRGPQFDVTRVVPTFKL